MARLAVIRAVLMRQPVRLAARLGMLCALAALQSACAATPVVKTVEWREEVKLSNQVIVLKRSITYREVSEPGRGSGWLADTERVEAKFEVTTERQTTWEARLKPLCIDISNQGVIYLVAAVGTAQGRREYAVPEGSYHVAFRSSGSAQWERISLAAVPTRLSPNFLIDTYTAFIQEGFLTDRVIGLEFKVKANADPRIYAPFRHCGVD